MCTMHEVRRAIPIDTINVDNSNYESIFVPPIAALSGQDSANLISFWILRPCMSARDRPFWLIIKSHEG